MYAQSSVFNIVICVTLMFSAAWAQDVPASKQTSAQLYVSAIEAAEMLVDPDVVLLDIRSRAEVAFVGLPTRVNLHLPYMVMPMVPEFDRDRATYALEMNPDFPLAFMRWDETNALEFDTPIILMCRSGNRSARAANLLAGMGFTQVYSMVDGFEGDRASSGPDFGRRVVNGWRNAGLEWSYTIRSDQAYPNDL